MLNKQVLGRHVVPGTMQVAEGTMVNTDTVPGLIKARARKGHKGVK